MFSNTWIHIIFIPTLLTTQAGLIRMAATEHRDLKFGMDGTFAVGVFDSPKDNEYVIEMWNLFLLFMCAIYIRCDVLTGIFCCLMMSSQIALVKVLIDADKGESPLFGGNLWTITLYLYLFGWTTQFVGHGIFERKYLYL
jgi:uncharacterized membrane protein YGL010W